MVPIGFTSHLGVREVGLGHRDALVRGDDRIDEGVGLRRDLRALQLGARLHEAVKDARLLHVHHVGEELDAAVVVEGLGLVGEVNRARLVAHVARVVAESRRGDPRDHDLLRVAPRACHACGRVQARARRLPLVDAVQDGRVVLDSCDAVGYALALLALVGEASDSIPVVHVGGIIATRDACGLQAHSTARRSL